jgi:hypothetical protein
VYVVCPGPTDTALFADYKQGAGNPEKLEEAFRRSIPLGRIGRPEDLPGAILFFASDDAAYVTGQVLSVSGGLTMNGCSGGGSMEFVAPHPRNSRREKSASPIPANSPNRTAPNSTRLGMIDVGPRCRSKGSDGESLSR